MRTRNIVIGLFTALVLIVLAIMVIPRVIEPDRMSTETYWPTQGWQTSTPEEQGFDSGKLADGLDAIQEKNIHIDSLLIIRNGYMILDSYLYPFDNNIPHKLASVTKSVMTTLIGIAIDQGKFQLDQPMVSFFSEREIANLDANKKLITVRHLVSMRNGFDSGCLSGDEYTLNKMRANPDWVQASLDRKMAREPGKNFCYDSPGMHLLSAILQQATGMTALDFAQQYLFEPLGIQEVLWESDPQGYTHGWGDLYLKPRDAAKIGYLWLNHGIWEGNQIVSSRWVADSVTAYSNSSGDGYGYGWWVSDDNYYAYGRGGQNIKVFPSYNAIVVTTASGFEYDQIAPMLTEAFVDPIKPLPANPTSLAELDKKLIALSQAPHGWSTGPLPEITKKISNQTYLLKQNTVGITTLHLEFENLEEAMLYIRIQGNDEIWPIGLDGKYRMSVSGNAQRGYWADLQTFLVEVFEDGLSTLQLQFEDNGLEISSPELGLRLHGQIENPR